jgi:subtilisin family serine protease
MKRIFGFPLAIILIATGAPAQDAAYKYWVQFSDKEGSPYSIERPEEFLSSRAIERRERYDIQIQRNDLPVNPAYIDSIQTESIRVLYPSKWLNGAVIETSDSNQAAQLVLRSFVNHVELLSQPPCPKKSEQDKFEVQENVNATALFSDHQIKMLQGHMLHEMGYRGDSMVIALLDTGYEGADTLPGFDSLFINGQILGTRNFVEPGKEVYALGQHGTHVLSIMGGNLPGTYLGAAPAASYWLIETEDVRSEFHIEEANWLAGAEFADSAGADIINSSLGYANGFTCPAKDYTYGDMDGNTTLVTKAADLAASKGMLVVTSAGNSGRPDNPWQYVNAPADGDSVLTVGAVDADGHNAAFSSRGPTFDGRVKPDVVAQGVNTLVLRAWGTIDQGSGTSFSSPIIAGLAACLWQKHPELSNYELIEAIRQSSDQYPYPDYRVGYGKPNFMVASDLITSDRKGLTQAMNLLVYPNPAKQTLHLSIPLHTSSSFRYNIMDLAGRSLLAGSINASAGSASVQLDRLAPGIYIITLHGEPEVFNAIFTRE